MTLPRRHPPATVAAALDLAGHGVPDVDVAQQVGVHPQTVRRWRRGLDRAAERARACDACGLVHRRDDLPAPQYAYLLGVYLGDGHIRA